MPKITKRVVDATNSTDRDVLVWDAELPGFGLRVKPSGTKSYVLQYRNQEGRSRRLTIGRHGPVTTERAREKALRLLANIAEGADPADEKADARKAPTVAELTARYLAEGRADKPTKKALELGGRREQPPSSHYPTARGSACRGAHDRGRGQVSG
jgi:hypothetical protein